MIKGYIGRETLIILFTCCSDSQRDSDMLYWIFNTWLDVKGKKKLELFIHSIFIDIFVIFLYIIYYSSWIIQKKKKPILHYIFFKAFSVKL